MGSREKILSALGIARNRGFEVELSFPILSFGDRVCAFVENLKKAGGESIVVEGELSKILAREVGDADSVVDTTSILYGSFSYKKGEEVDVAILGADLAVAENGALWIDTEDRYPRSLLTLARKIVVILEEDAIVDTMHQAYERVDFSKVSYALFMSGPSKTADIEQSLVFGAHGAVAMTAVLIPPKRA